MRESVFVNLFEEAVTQRVVDMVKRPDYFGRDLGVERFAHAFFNSNL
jgi:hypothetical protein